MVAANSYAHTPQPIALSSLMPHVSIRSLVLSLLFCVLTFSLGAMANAVFVGPEGAFRQLRGSTRPRHLVPAAAMRND